MVGAKKYQQEPRTRNALNAFEAIDITQEIAERSVNLRQEYGIKLPDAIILVAAQIERRELVTLNKKDFAGMPGVVTSYQL